VKIKLFKLDGNVKKKKISKKKKGTKVGEAGSVLLSQPFDMQIFGFEK